LSLASNVEISQEAMKEVAAETGGRVYINQNEILQGVVLAAADEKASYTIGYYPDNKKWDGKYRHIKVKVGRDGIEARCRQGYFAVDPAQIKASNPGEEVAAALELRAPAPQVLFMAQAKPTEAGKVKVVFSCGCPYGDRGRYRRKQTDECESLCQRVRLERQGPGDARHKS
jgi:hypothetical protein